jgi:hypothetical protein
MPVPPVTKQAHIRRFLSHLGLTLLVPGGKSQQEGNVDCIEQEEDYGIDKIQGPLDDDYD